jgi:tRNA(Ile)-lysidine synthase
MTTRSHPPTLLKLTRRTILDEHLVAPGDTVLVAVSGGPDSMALLHVLSTIATPLRFHLVAHGVDHGLRDAAQGELALAATLARDLGVPFSTTRVDVGRGPNVMARARRARFEALRAALVKAGGNVIATGHHADDRAETVLMRMLRGSGPAGLAVLPGRSSDLIRPMIRARHADILAHLERHGIPFSLDPSNSDPRYLRTRVRYELLPMLAALSPAIVDHLCSLADALAQAKPLQGPTVDGQTLGRAQRVALANALSTRNAKARVPLPGGAVARVDLHTGRIVVINDGAQALTASVHKPKNSTA